MNILSLDTCFDACSVAAGRGLRSLTPGISFAFEAMQKGHAERLLPMIEMVMCEAGLEFKSLDRIAVTYGPGTFTGTRICVSAARALALATGARDRCPFEPPVNGNECQDTCRSDAAHCDSDRRAARRGLFRGLRSPHAQECCRGPMRWNSRRCQIARARPDRHSRLRRRGSGDSSASGRN